MPPLVIPSLEELKSTSFHFGMKEVMFLPKQWELVFASEPEMAYIGGYGSGKTQTGIMRATRLSTWFPGNRGIIGRYASTDLASTTQRDAIEFWEQSNLLHDFKEKGRYKIPTAILKCVDPFTQEVLPGMFSEVQFLHLDNPTHIHGHRIGWAWADEASEISREAYDKLMSRIRLKGFEATYSLWVTGNPEGHNWIYNHFFNPELLAKTPERVRSSRRAVHATTYDNWFLPSEYVRNMTNSYSETMRKKYLEGSFDIFDGQIYDEFDSSIHVLGMETFPGGVPSHWNRLLGVDVGGTDPWAWIWVAVDDAGNVVVYDEIYEPGTRIKPFAIRAKPKLDGLKFQSKVIDSENKLAAGELGEHGIHFTNAKKTNKNESIFRLSGYLHPNPDHAFPKWHPRHGQSGSPRLFITANCRSLIGELPQQRWRKVRGQELLANEPDPNVPNHAVDALLYICRELPRPTALTVGIISDLHQEMSKMGKIINFERRQAEAEKRKMKWAMHMGSGRRSYRKPRMVGWPS